MVDDFSHEEQAKRLDCWENEGGADRAPHQEGSDATSCRIAGTSAGPKLAQSIAKGDQ
jgi:hypothetical protein